MTDASNHGRETAIDDERRVGGRRLVVGLFVFVLAFVVVVGAILGAVVSGVEPQAFGVVSLPGTPAGVALFGLVTVGVALLVVGGGLAVATRIAER